MRSWLDGKKTYILAILIGLLSAVCTIDVTLTDDPQTAAVETTIPLAYYVIAGGLLGPAGLASLRAGVSRNGLGQ